MTAPAVAAVMQALSAEASAKVRDEMGPRYGIVAPSALGVPMAKMKRIAERFGPDHALAEALWRTGIYEARMVACMVDDPAQVTGEQMDRWRADFDNWAIVDTVCFKLFDRTPCAFEKVDAWAGLNDEFGRRAAFALLACLALHRKAEDREYLDRLPLIEAAAGDPRNFVSKGVSWALRAVGGRRSPPVRAAARELAAKLAKSQDRAERWVGKDAQRAFAKADARPVSA